MSTKHLYPLGKVKQIVEAVGMGVSYAHEELVFLEHNGFLLEFTDRENEILVHPNIEADGAELAPDLARLLTEAANSGLRFSESCPYRLSEVDEANIRIEFIDE